MKKLITIASLCIVCTASAQTFKYLRVETTHFGKDDAVTSKLIRVKSGIIDLHAKTIAIDMDTDKPQVYDIVRVGHPEPADEGYYSVEYICVTTTKTGALKAVRCLAFYSPKNALCDVVVKNGHSNVDYCISDK